MSDVGNRERFREILQALWDHHGKQTPEEGDDILGVLIRTILSQSTSNANSRRAFGDLLDTFSGDWGAIAEAPVDEVAESIRVGGLSNQKAPRIQNILRRVREEESRYSLDFLRDISPTEARDYLTDFKGVGPKTAAFTLMYAAGVDLFPMDTHIFRILERLGFLSGRESDRRAHLEMQELVPDGEAYPAHMVLVRHGREICHARRPACDDCPIRPECPFPDG